MPAEWCRGLILTLLLAVPPLAHAVQVPDLYVAEVLVTSQDSRQFSQGARAALMQVLTRVSGDPGIEQHPVALQALRRVDDFYYQFAYESTERTFQVGDSVVPATLLRIYFEPSAIAGLLRDAGYPVWGSNRPSVLVWIAFDDGSERRLLAEDAGLALNQALEVEARRRGVPLLYPVLDLEDASAISVAEVWGAFLGRIEGASGRYTPDAILTGRVTTGRGEWAGRWALQVDGEWAQRDDVTLSAENLARDVIDALADDLAARYAIGSARDELWLRVGGVETTADYAGVMAYLEALSPVLEVAVSEVADDGLLLRLSIEGELEQLMQTIALDEKLVLVNAATGESKAAPVRYGWIKGS